MVVVSIEVQNKFGRELECGEVDREDGEILLGESK